MINVPQDGVRTFLPSSVISGLARGRLTTGTSDHPARPPFQLYRENTCGKDRDFMDALSKLLQPKQLLEFGFGEDRDAEFFGFVILRSGIGPHNDVVRLLAHGP
jgi:hypothetical protein